MHCALDCCLVDLIIRHRHACNHSALQSFVKINDHDDARFNCDSEKGDISNPDRHAEVVAQCPLQDKTACERVDSWENQNSRFRYRVEDHVEQHKNDEEHDG